MMDWLNDLSGHWFWLSLGLILIAAEMAGTRDTVDVGGDDT